MARQQASPMMQTLAQATGDGAAGLGFDLRVPGWMWLGAIMLAIAVSVWCYRSLPGPRAARAALGALRFGTIVALLVLLAGPRWERARERVEPDTVVVLADRSGSMGLADAPGDDGRVTRDEQLAKSLASSADGLRAVMEMPDRVVRWLGFSAGAFPIEVPGPEDMGQAAAWAAALGPADGRRTSVESALAQSLTLSSGKNLAGVVVMSDGRSVAGLSEGLLERLAGERVPVFVLPLGSERPVADVAVEDVDAPASAYVRDDIPIRVRVGVDGISQGDDAIIDVRALDAQSGRLLGSTRALAEAGVGDEGADAGGRFAEAVLTVRLGEAGARRIRIEAVRAGEDLTPANNVLEIGLDVVDEPVRVLHIDGAARWEQRFVKNLLLREPWIESASLLLATGRRHIQEGVISLASLPASPEEWARFDVVVIGEVRPELMTVEQMRQLREHVATRGGGLLWMAAPGQSRFNLADTPLADLLPMATRSVDPGLGGVRLRTWDEDVVIRRTELAQRLGLLTMAASVGGGSPGDGGWLDRLGDPATGWSRLRWAQRIEPELLKPAAEVLALAHPASSPDDASQARPIVVSMRYGSGRVIYVGTDETWRYRYGLGETLQERFWIPMLRALARERLSNVGRGAVLDVSPAHSVVEQPTRIELRLSDQRLIDRRMGEVEVLIEPVDEAGAVRDGGADRARRVVLRSQDAGSDRALAQVYAETWLASEPGRYRVRVSDPALASHALERELMVRSPNDELAQPRADHALLATLAVRSGGRVLAAGDLARLAELLPNRAMRVPLSPQTEPLWDRWWVLALLLAMLVAEWLGRKALSLA